MAGSKPEDERRRAPRVSVSVSFSETDPRTVTPVSNVSETGAFVVSNELYPIGSTVELTFVVLPQEPRLFQAMARVVRHQDNPRGMGVEFLELSEAMKSLVLRLIEADRADRQKTSRRGRRRTWSMS
jgi:c-di-GMP-binding flagellar brake protein YcgR